MVLTVEPNVSGNGILQQNCREDWPTEVCTFANICGLCSAAIWFVVLFPQLWKNFRRKSVRGLSFLWAVANFTASLVNLFFVFKLKELPAYAKIQAVYQPTLELSMLVQFFWYGRQYSLERRLVVAGVCLVAWGALITLQLTLDIYQQMEWVAIVLWSVETFPQVILNMKMQSTSGQATKSVMLSLVGKLTDFLSTYLLVLPLQYVIMAYFSSSMCYINGLQVVWYWGQQGKLAGGSQHHQSQDILDPSDGDADADVTEGNETHGTGSTEMGPEEQPLIIQRELEGTAQQGTFNNSCTREVSLRGAASIILCLVLVGYQAGLVWNVWSPLVVLPPITIAVILTVAWLYLNMYIFGRFRQSRSI